MSGNWTRNAFVYLLILVAAAALFLNVYGPNERPENVSLSDVARQVERGDIARIDVPRGKVADFFAWQRSTAFQPQRGRRCSDTNAARHGCLRGELGPGKN